MAAIDPRLLDEIRRGNCVAFVGAGFSAVAGLPSWPALLRAAAVRRVEGKGTPPIVIFGGAEFEAQNRRRALGLGALGFTSEWPVLMGLTEQTLGQSPEPR